MNVIKYNLYLIGRELSLNLSQEQGQKLAIILMQPNCPKFVLVDDDVVAVSSISHLKQVFSEERTNKMGYKEDFAVGEERELTESEKVTNRNYLALKEGFMEKLK